MAQPVMSRMRVPAETTATAGFVLSAVAPLCEVTDIKEIPACLAEAAAAILGTRQTFSVLCDRLTGRPELASLCSREHESHLRGFFENSWDSHGSLVPASLSTDAITGPGLWMVPVIHDSRIEALVGVVTGSPDGPAAGHLDTLRALSRVTGPVVASLRDAQGLRSKVDELEALLQIKSSMMSYLSHELRSLLAAVRGYARRMADGRAGAIGQTAHQHLEVILRNTDRLLDLATHTLPFVTEQPVRIESFDLREPLESVLKRMKRGDPARFQTIMRQIPPEPFLVTGDRERLLVVFGILLATATEGAAERAKTTVQFLRGANEEVTVKILTSRELPPQLVDRIFDHCEESVPPAVPLSEPGLAGFSLAHDLIWLHGGRITLTSRSGEGTAVLFTLPAAQSRLQAQTIPENT